MTALSVRAQRDGQSKKPPRPTSPSPVKGEIFCIHAGQLLGLLGTIMGLIQAFTAVANANPAEKADLLSASISVAMNTTAFGLMVAIPLLIVHAILTSKTGDIVDSLEMATVKSLNVFSRRAKRMSEAAVAV